MNISCKLIRTLILGSLVFSTILLSACGALPEKNANHSNALHAGEKVTHYARQFLGTPYQYGGNSPSGFDCSGLVQYSHKLAGITVPRTTREQLKQITPIRHSQLQKGDLIFFRLDGRKISHVAIYYGNNSIIHAPSSGKTVSIARLDNGYWEKHIARIGRFY